MKKLAIMLTLLAGMFLSGCGTVDSCSDRCNRYKMINNLQMRGAVDDWDYIWLYERNSHLTEWHPRVGY